MNFRKEIEKIKNVGYNEANAEARLCQDIILKAISESDFKHNVTIKGGVVMRNLSGSVRRATQDIDLDFIRYSISNDSILRFIEKLNQMEGVIFSRKMPRILGYLYLRGIVPWNTYITHIVTYSSGF